MGRWNTTGRGGRPDTRIGLVRIAHEGGDSLVLLDHQRARGRVGRGPRAFGATLASDVLTVRDDVATFFSDPGRVVFSLGLKDPGPSNSPSSPTQNNFITISRYRVRYIRSDGRNTEGVDVPYLVRRRVHGDSIRRDECRIHAGAQSGQAGSATESACVWNARPVWRESGPHFNDR